MPAEKDIQVVAFMQCVMDALDVSKPAHLQALLIDEGIFEWREARKIPKWANGENGPAFHSMMRLLRRAGFLTHEAISCLDLQMRLVIAKEESIRPPPSR